MERRFQKIYVWSFIIVAGIVMLLLYTPIGGNLYTWNGDDQLYQLQPGVDFNKRITNSPGSMSGGGGYNSSSYNVPNYSYNSSPGYSAGGSGGSTESFLQGGSGGGGAMIPETSNSLNSYGGQSSSETYSGSAGGSGSSGAGGGSGVSGGTTLPSAELAQITENLGLTNDDEVTKAGNQTLGNGGATDPGGDPEGPMIPVGGNVFYLLFMLIPYIAYKRLKFKFEKK